MCPRTPLYGPLMLPLHIRRICSPVPHYMAHLRYHCTSYDRYVSPYPIIWPTYATIAHPTDMFPVPHYMAHLRYYCTSDGYVPLYPIIWPTYASIPHPTTDMFPCTQLYGPPMLAVHILRRICSLVYIYVPIYPVKCPSYATIAHPTADMCPCTPLYGPLTLPLHILRRMCPCTPLYGPLTLPLHILRRMCPCTPLYGPLTLPLHILRRMCPCTLLYGPLSLPLHILRRICSPISHYIAHSRYHCTGWLVNTFLIFIVFHLSIFVFLSFLQLWWTPLIHW